MDPNKIVDMVNRRGRVISVRYWEVEDEKKKGSRMIINPRERYYPQYDQELNASAANTNIVENLDEADILPVELL